jgi:alternate signal-mediated exported protein
MKINFTKNTITLTSIALLLLITVGTTLALVFTNTAPVENTFKPSKVSCAVVEGTNAPVENSNVDIGAVKQDVKIKNTGDTDAFIRVAVVVNWMSEGGKVWAVDPVLAQYATDPNGEYFIEFNTNSNWIQGADGYWYYTKSVAPGASTQNLINNAYLMDGVTGPKGTDGTQYYLSIEIVASAIQSTPTDVVKGEWGVTVNSNGEISK